MQIEKIGAVPRPATPIFIRLERHLDLDDIGTPIGKVARSGRPGAGAGQIDHLEAGQRAFTLLNHQQFSLVLDTRRDAAYAGAVTPSARSCRNARWHAYAPAPP